MDFGGEAAAGATKTSISTPFLLVRKVSLMTGAFAVPFLLVEVITKVWLIGHRGSWPQCKKLSTATPGLGGSHFYLIGFLRFPISNCK
jgi:hypothetical protein